MDHALTCKKEGLKPGSYYNGVKIPFKKGLKILWVCRACLFPRSARSPSRNFRCHHCMYLGPQVAVPVTKDTYSEQHKRFVALHYQLVAAAMLAIESGQVTGFKTHRALLRSAGYGGLRPYKGYTFLSARFGGLFWCCDLSTQRRTYRKVDMLRIRDVFQAVRQHKMTQFRLSVDTRDTIYVQSRLRGVPIVQVVREMIAQKRASVVRQSKFSQLTAEQCAQIDFSNLSNVVEVD